MWALLPIRAHADQKCRAVIFTMPHQPRHSGRAYLACSLSPRKEQGSRGEESTMHKGVGHRVGMGDVPFLSPIAPGNPCKLRPGEHLNHR